MSSDIQTRKEQSPFKIDILKCLVFRTPLYFSFEVFGVEWLEPLKVKLLSKLKLFINLLLTLSKTRCTQFSAWGCFCSLKDFKCTQKNILSICHKEFQIQHWINLAYHSFVNTVSPRFRTQSSQERSECLSQFMTGFAIYQFDIHWRSD